MDSEAPDFLDTQLRLLGQVTYHSAAMESTLRTAFCALVGSKFAAIVAAGQSTVWFIDQCKALTDAHHEMPESSRNAIKVSLNRCKTANDRRNDLVHGIKTGVAVDDGSFETIRSRLRKHMPTVQKWTPASLNEVTMELARADSELFGAIMAAVGPEVMSIDVALI